MCKCPCCHAQELLVAYSLSRWLPPVFSGTERKHTYATLQPDQLYRCRLFMTIEYYSRVIVYQKANERVDIDADRLSIAETKQTQVKENVTRKRPLSASRANEGG